LRERASGILLHATSLPGPHGCGDLGAEARAFADRLVASGQRWWQMLPVGPPGYGDSPYSALSAFAGSPLLVDLDALGIDVESAELPAHEVDYEKTYAFRDAQLRRALRLGRDTRFDRRAFDAFCEREAAWLEDFALFAALKRAHGGVEWTRWEEDVRLRRAPALARARRAHAEEIELAKFVQWRFDEQWRALRAYCNERGVGLIGDLPIFVAHDSADVWQNRDIFELDREGLPKVVTGVPPDYFSATGQRWGNPHYRWGRLRESGFSWWVDRFHCALERFDVVRIDHFIGFVRAWQIPASEPTAMNGTWVPGPGRELFERVREEHGSLPLVAEDLGLVTKEVTQLRIGLRLPGIRIVQFAFGTDPQAPKFLPHAHVRNSVVYTGTHDNDTIVGWFDDRGGGPDSTRTPEEAERERRAALAYLGRETRGEIHWEMIRLALSSVARTAIIPMQDVLGLGSEARMNRPGNPSGNWRWRMADGAFDDAVAERLHDMTRTYGRTS
jgi:4-alpha-glucanotransferase